MTKTKIDMVLVPRPEFVDRRKAVNQFFNDLENIGDGGALKQWFPTYTNAKRGYHAIWHRLNARGRGQEFTSHITPEDDGYALYITKK